MEPKAPVAAHSRNAARIDTLNVDSRLPGSHLIEQGLEHLATGVTSVESLLVSIGAVPLRTLGLAVPPVVEQPEFRLYALLAKEHGDGAHSQYNALVRQLVSFQRAAQCAN